METEPILTPDVAEEGAKPKLFNSAIFAGITAASSEAPSPQREPEGIQKHEEIIPLTVDDIRGLFEAPFDFLAWKTSFPQWKLSEEQTQRLCRLWLKPLSKIAAKTQNFDVILAAIASFGIVMEKIGDYSIEHHNRTRNEGQRENELSKEQTA